MNDFTKDELTLIQYAINQFKPKESDYPDVDPLFHKLQSMIDNYCEHYWTSGGTRPWLHCIKCKANFDHH